ncbi:NUDIX hydrolase [Tomitella cavernea]|uniref:NUDIX hydrolase n=1 Tax=Tomitella cavernea TaxID=1387982 RepID=UPI003CD0ADDC
MPKGHVEAGETVEQTATREIAEETGIRGEVLASLGSIDYWFVSDGRRIHKTVHHFLLRYQGGELSDEDYEVSEVEWVPLGELSGRLAYADERKLAAVAAEILGEMISGPSPRDDASGEAGAPPRPQPGAEPSKRARRRRRNHRAMLPKPRGRPAPHEDPDHQAVRLRARGAPSGRRGGCGFARVRAGRSRRRRRRPGRACRARHRGAHPGHRGSNTHDIASQDGGRHGDDRRGDDRRGDDRRGDIRNGVTHDGRGRRHTAGRLPPHRHAPVPLAHDHHRHTRGSQRRSVHRRRGRRRPRGRAPSGRPRGHRHRHRNRP